MEQIAKAFCKAQKEFAPALKTNTNPHFKSKYVGLDGCVEAVIDALNNNGIALIQKPIDCDSGVKIETVFMHESGEILSGGVLHVPASKQDAQGYGSALTYARRYGLMAACGIAPEDDDGNAAARKPKDLNHPEGKGDLQQPAMPELKSVQLSDFDEESQQFLKDTAIEMIAAVEQSAPVDAYNLSRSLTNDEKQAIWHLLDSKTRTALKKYAQEQQRKAA